MSSLFIRDTAVVALTPAADHTEKRGYLVEIDGNGKSAIINSAADLPFGVIVDGQDSAVANAQDSIAVLGGNIGTVPMVAGAAITKGQRLQSQNDGTVIPDAAAGARVIVGRAMEDAAAGERFEAVGYAPIALS